MVRSDEICGAVYNASRSTPSRPDQAGATKQEAGASAYVDLAHLSTSDLTITTRGDILLVPKKIPASILGPGETWNMSKEGNVEATALLQDCVADLEFAAETAAKPLSICDGASVPKQDAQMDVEKGSRKRGVGSGIPRKDGQLAQELRQTYTLGPSSGCLSTMRGSCATPLHSPTTK
eukprot:2737260-Amphidinium_carterae.3